MKKTNDFEFEPVFYKDITITDSIMNLIVCGIFHKHEWKDEVRYEVFAQVCKKCGRKRL